jgi:multidrug transporter EmrE-like cation transporter
MSDFWMVETQSGLARAVPYLAMGAVIIGNVLGNVFLKLGSSVDASRAQIFGMFGWQTVAGIGFFAAGILCYALALKSLPLHVAQAIAALQFVGAIAAAAMFFGEAITALKWVGIALICVGLVLVVD